MTTTRPCAAAAAAIDELSVAGPVGGISRHPAARQQNTIPFVTVLLGWHSLAHSPDPGKPGIGGRLQGDGDESTISALGIISTFASIYLKVD
jgi:hypothetical protein